VLVTQPAPSENGSATIKQVLPNWIRVTPFLRGGRGVMHMKVCMTYREDLYVDMDLVPKVLLAFLQVRQITDRHLNREPDGSRLARH
jgi:hypothetical protein